MIHAQFKGLDRLILDLTMNGGGDITLGRALLQFLFPSGQDWGPTQMPSSVAARNMTQTSVRYGILETEWSPSFYSDNYGIPFNQNSTEWLIPGMPRVYGNNLHRNYSQFIHIDCSNPATGCSEFPFTMKNHFKPQNILIANYGFCGSTCALFANHLSNYEGIKTVSIGGIQGSPQQYTSFPVLEVLETPSVYW